MLNFFRNFLSYFIIFFFSLSVATAIFTFDLKETFLNQYTLKKVLSDGKVYEFLVDDFLPSFLNDQFSKDKSNPTVPASLLKSLTEKVVPPASLRADTEKALDTLIPYLNGQSKTLLITVDLTAYKKRLSENIEPVLTSYIESLHTCQEGAEGTDLEQIPSCKPKNTSAAQIVSQIPIADLQNSLTGLPNQLLLKESGVSFEPNDTVAQVGQKESFNLKNIQQAIGWLNLVIVGSIVTSLVSILLLLLIWLGNLRMGLRKLSLAFFSTSVLPAAAGALLLASENQSLWSGLNIKLSNAWIKPFADQLGRLLLFQALFLFAVGLAIFILLNTVLRERPNAKTKEELKEG